MSTVGSVMLRAGVIIARQFVLSGTCLICGATLWSHRDGCCFKGYTPEQIHRMVEVCEELDTGAIDDVEADDV